MTIFSPENKRKKISNPRADGGVAARRSDAEDERGDDGVDDVIGDEVLVTPAAEVGLGLGVRRGVAPAVADALQPPPPVHVNLHPHVCPRKGEVSY